MAGNNFYFSVRHGEKVFTLGFSDEWDFLAALQLYVQAVADYGFGAAYELVRARIDRESKQAGERVSAEDVLVAGVRAFQMSKNREVLTNGR